MATQFFTPPMFSPQANVQTIRPSSTALLTIDSEDRFSNGYTDARRSQTFNASLGVSIATPGNYSPYDFSITKNESIMNGFFTRLGLTEVSFDWGIPNINPKTNRVYVNWSNVSNSTSGQSLIGLFDGVGTFATPSQIATEMTSNVAAANSNLADFTMTYGEQSSGGSGFPAFRYSSGSSNVSVWFTPLANNNGNYSNGSYYPFPTTTKQLFDVLGLTQANSIFYSVSGETIESPGTATYCSATQYVDIVCSELTYNQPLKDTMTQQIARDSLCRLYLGDMNGFGNNTLPCYDSNFCPPGCRAGTIYRQFQTPKMINWKPDQPVPSGLRFQVYDDAGANLGEMCGETNLSGGAVNAANTQADFLNWRATILVSEN